MHPARTWRTKSDCPIRDALDNQISCCFRALISAGVTYGECVAGTENRAEGEMRCEGSDRASCVSMYLRSVSCGAAYTHRP